MYGHSLHQYYLVNLRVSSQLTWYQRAGIIFVNTLFPTLVPRKNRAMTDTSMELKWFCHLWGDMSVLIPPHISLYCDNKSTSLVPQIPCSMFKQSILKLIVMWLIRNTSLIRFFFHIFLHRASGWCFHKAQTIPQFRYFLSKLPVFDPPWVWEDVKRKYFITSRIHIHIPIKTFPYICLYIRAYCTSVLFSQLEIFFSINNSN